MTQNGIRLVEIHITCPLNICNYQYEKEKDKKQHVCEKSHFSLIQGLAHGKYINHTLNEDPSKAPPFTLIIDRIYFAYNLSLISSIYLIFIDISMKFSILQQDSCLNLQNCEKSALRGFQPAQNVWNVTPLATKPMIVSIIYNTNFYYIFLLFMNIYIILHYCSLRFIFSYIISPYYNILFYFYFTL